MIGSNSRARLCRLLGNCLKQIPRGPTSARNDKDNRLAGTIAVATACAKESVSQLFFRPAGARRFYASYPRLAPWAVFLRRFAAIAHKVIPFVRPFADAGGSEFSRVRSRWTRLSSFLTACGVLVAALGSTAVGTTKQATNPSRLGVLDSIVQEAIRDEQIPGAVVLVGHDGQAIYRKAFGERALEPRREPMTVDTIFDLASLTKVIATTTAVMQLVEKGRIRVNEPVAKYIPEFAENGKEEITVRELLTHHSGLPADLDLSQLYLSQPGQGRETAFHMAYAEKPIYAPGSRFLYSDINFIVLGALVERVSGMSLNEYCQKNIFVPLRMAHTRFLPPAAWLPKIAPTQYDEHDKMLRGVVHDPTARRMGGVAGHAGIFSTADDLAKFAQALLNGGGRVLAPITGEKMTTPQQPPAATAVRGFGWDLDSPFSSSRGELFPIGSYGHTGFTGTSLWIDPFSRTYVILLTNAVHPHRGKSVNSLRSRVATIAAASFGIAGGGVNLSGYNETIVGPGLHRAVESHGQVLTGLDVLAQQHFAPLQGKRIGLITNQTGVDRNGKRNIYLMTAAGVTVTALFSPEHGLFGSEDRPDIPNTKDPASGISVFSLFQPSTRRITPEMLQGVDLLVFDIQDVGARFYTYSCTMLYSMEEAGKRRLPFFVLDRPNPITGGQCEGP